MENYVAVPVPQFVLYNLERVQINISCYLNCAVLFVVQ